MREYRQHIGGEWISSDRKFEDIDPYRGTVMGLVPAGTPGRHRQLPDLARAGRPT